MQLLLKICQIIILIFMLGLLALRITIWIIMYQDHSENSLVETMDEKLNNTNYLVDQSFFYVTLCNINFARYDLKFMSLLVYIFILYFPIYLFIKIIS